MHLKFLAAAIQFKIEIVALKELDSREEVVARTWKNVTNATKLTMHSEFEFTWDRNSEAKRLCNYLKQKIQ